MISIGETLSSKHGYPAITGISETFKIEADKLITGRTIIISQTRYGKSWTNRRIIEQLVGKAGIVIVDPEGEYSSLREKYPFLIIGKEIPLQLETAEFMAETVLKQELSVIIDLSLIDEDLGKEYVSLFVQRFMFLETTQRKPYLFFFEELDEFAPERGVGKAISTHAVRNLAKKGGKRGIGMVGVTHRPAWVSKGVLSQCTTLKIVGCIEWEADLDVIQDFLRISKDIVWVPKQKGKPYHDGKPHIPILKQGEFYITGTAVTQEAFVKVGKVQTTHLGATPEVMPPTPKALEDVVRKLRAELPKIVEQIKTKIPPITEIRKEAELKAEKKWKISFQIKLEKEKKRITAKLHSDIEELTKEKNTLRSKIEEIGRSADLQGQFAPLSDVFEHPLVKARMTKLEQEEIDLLRKIELEPNLTREHLAAFLNASRDRVKSRVDKINRTFKAQVIVGVGRPIHYRSMLKRLFLTDVAKREISALERLQNKGEEQKQTITRLFEVRRSQEAEIGGLKEQLKGLPSPGEIADLKNTIQLKKDQQKKQDITFKKANKQLRVYDSVFKNIQKILNEVSIDTPSACNIVAHTEETAPIKVEMPSTDAYIPMLHLQGAKTFLKNYPDKFFKPIELSIAAGFDAKSDRWIFDELKKDSTIEFDPNQGYRFKGG